MTVREQIRQLSDRSFRQLLDRVAATTEFGKLFNRGAESLNDTEKELLRKKLIEFGIAFDTDEELAKICYIINERVIAAFPR